jgi:hypothetical protein
MRRESNGTRGGYHPPLGRYLWGRAATGFPHRVDSSQRALTTSRFEAADLAKRPAFAELGEISPPLKSASHDRELPTDLGRIGLIDRSSENRVWMRRCLAGSSARSPSGFVSMAAIRGRSYTARRCMIRFERWRIPMSNLSHWSFSTSHDHHCDRC